MGVFGKGIFDGRGLPSTTERVRAAIRNAGPYFEQVCEMRASQSGKAMGSTYPSSVARLRSRVLRATWRPYSHPQIKPPAVGFISRDMPVGNFGLIPVSHLDARVKIELVDPKGTGYVEGLVRKKVRKMRADFTVALIGPAPNGGESLWTFFPGEPIMPSTIPAAGNVGKLITPKAALSMGLVWVKLGG